VGSGPSPLSCGVFLPLPLLQAFPLLISGCMLLLLPCPAGLFIYSSREKWAFRPLLWSFPPTATSTSFLAPGCWACAVALAFSSQLVVRDFPSPPSVLRAPLPLCYVSFLLLLLIIQVFFSFFLCGGRSVQGGYADLAQGSLWEYCVLLSSPCGLHLPKPSGHWCLAVARGPSWFLRLT
jgi:hypothetical protein